MSEETWKNYILNWGNKWRGKTLFMIYVNDFDYLVWMDMQDYLPSEIKKMIQYPLMHKKETDPYSKSGFSEERETPSQRFYRRREYE